MITREDKRLLIDKIKSIFTDSSSIVFVNFKGLNVSDSMNIRRSLKSDEVRYFVARKTLIKKVLKEAKLKGVMPELTGELALVYGTDSIAPARSIYQFQKKTDGKIQIIGGVFDGEYKNNIEMTSIASIPSIHTLRGMFVNIINSPIQRFAIALNAIAQTK